MLLHSFYLIISIAVLIIGADKFVDNSSILAKKLNLTDLTIGLTVVALGTSAPEIFVGISSIFRESEELAAGTIIGSNISNIALIFGISLIGLKSKPLRTQTSKFTSFILAPLVLGIALYDLKISSTESILLLLILIFYIYRIFNVSKIEISTLEAIPHESSSLKVFFYLILGLLGLIFGSYFTVENAEIIARLSGVSELVIGLTILALGTSLPELAATIAAIYRKKNGLIIGNIIGSNVLNIVLVVPIIGLFSDKQYSPELLTRDYLFMSILSILLVLVVRAYSNRLSVTLARFAGLIFISSYIGYILILGNLI